MILKDGQVDAFGPKEEVMKSNRVRAVSNNKSETPQASKSGDKPKGTSNSKTVDKSVSKTASKPDSPSVSTTNEETEQKTVKTKANLFDMGGKLNKNDSEATPKTVVNKAENADVKAASKSGVEK
jgi:hypothetical protein